MADPPFGFGPPGGAGRGSGSSSGSGSSGGSHGEGGNLGPLGPLGDPQQFADALRQFADLMSWQGGAVNWDLAKNVARHAVAAEGDPSVLEVDRQKIVDALRLADLWLDEVTSFPTGVRQAQAWSRSEWVEATLPVWSSLCDPIADKAVDAMGSILAEDPTELGAGLPEELGQALQAIGGGLSGLGGMMRRIGGMMVGSQTGAAVGALAREVVSSTDVGLPLGPEGTAALLPAGVAAFGAGLSVDTDQVRLFLALREAAHHRLFAHVPWLRGHLLSAVEDYARGITVDPSQLRAAMPQIDPANPEGIREARSGAALFQPEDTPQQKAALNRLETALALVEGWVDTVVDAAARPSTRSPPWSAWNYGRAGPGRPPRSGRALPRRGASKAGMRSGRTPTCCRPQRTSTTRTVSSRASMKSTCPNWKTPGPRARRARTAAAPNKKPLSTGAG